MLHQIKAQQFYTDLGLLSTVLSPTEISRIQGLSRLFPVLFKADLIFKDFSRMLSIFKYFSSLCEPWRRVCEGLRGWGGGYCCNGSSTVVCIFDSQRDK